MAHARCMLDASGYRHTLRICSTYCFSTATVVARTRLSVTCICTFPFMLLFYVKYLFPTANLIEKTQFYDIYALQFPLCALNRMIWRCCNRVFACTWDHHSKWLSIVMHRRKEMDWHLVSVYKFGFWNETW